MFPIKIILTRLPSSYTPSTCCSLRVHLLLNATPYGQIKQGQPRYLCVSGQDVLSIQLQSVIDQSVIGLTMIKELERIVREKKTVEIDVIDQKQMMQIKLAFSFEIVGKKKEVIGMTSQRQEEESAEECSGQFEHSFRINYREGNSQPRTVLQELSSQQIASQQNQSLESLAYQREKILGELFGRLKREK